MRTKNSGLCGAVVAVVGLSVAGCALDWSVPSGTGGAGGTTGALAVTCHTGTCECPVGGECAMTCFDQACTIVCGEGATCDIQCTKGACTLDCKAGAICTASCAEAASCVDGCGVAASCSCDASCQ